MSLCITEQVIILRPSCRQWIDIQDAAKVLVEANATVHSSVALATPSTTAFKTAIDNVGHPAQAKFAPSLVVRRALCFRAQENFMASGFADLPVLRKTGPASEPEPDGGGPCQSWIRGNPAGVVQEDALIPAKLFAELTIVVVVR